MRWGLATSRLGIGFLALLAWGASPGVAGAGSISVTYALTGGDTFGGFLGDVPIQSGTLVVTMPNPESGLPPIQTFAPSVYFRLTATDGATFTRLFLPAAFHSATASFAPGQTGRFEWRYRTPLTYSSITREVFLSVSPGGNLLSGRYAESRFGFYTTPGSGYVCCRRTGAGVINLTGQEVLVPEPASRSLSVTGLLGLAGLGAGAEFARRRRRRRPGRPGV